jgi:hypothetical protein
MWIPDLDTDVDESARKKLYKNARERERGGREDAADERELNPEEMRRLKRLRKIAAFSQASAAGVFTSSRFHHPQEDDL